MDENCAVNLNLASQRPRTSGVRPQRNMKNTIQRIFAYLMFYPTLWYDRLFSKVSTKRTWYTQIDDHVYLGALPFATYPQKLHALGVKAVVNMCQEWNQAASMFDELGIEQLHLPTVDFQFPSLLAIEQSVDFINQCIKGGKPVYVHCRAGRGRSATVVLCWLLATRSMSAQSAQHLLLQKRPHVIPNLWKRKVVTDFVARLGCSNDPTISQASP